MSMWKRLQGWVGQGGDGDDPAPADLVRRWAERQGLPWHPVADGEGLVVHGAWPDLAPGVALSGPRAGASWRLEWGPAQRAYLSGVEARWSVETGAPATLCVALLPQPLARRLEDELYAQCVDDVRTRLDEQTPPEVRWLMLHPRVPAAASALPAAGWTLVASDPAWAGAWLAPVASAWIEHADRAGDGCLAVLSLRRGRLSLRLAPARADDASLQRALALLQALVVALPLVPPSRPEASGGP